MTIQEQIQALEAQITELMHVLPQVTTPENKVKFNAFIIELSHEHHALVSEMQYERSVDAFNDRV